MNYNSHTNMIAILTGHFLINIVQFEATIHFQQLYMINPKKVLLILLNNH